MRIRLLYPDGTNRDVELNQIGDTETVKVDIYVPEVTALPILLRPRTTFAIHLVVIPDEEGDRAEEG